jgi:hypothetical protein
VEANEVSARWWYKRRQPAEKLARQKDENLRSVGQRALQAITEAAVGQPGETILRERRPGSIAAQMQKAFTVVGVQVYAGVQRETLEVRGLLPASAPLGRLADERRHRVCLSGSQRVSARPIRQCGVHARSQQLAYPPEDPTEDLRHFALGGRRQRDEGDRAVRVDEDAVGDHAMEMHVQVERSAKPLHKTDSPYARRARSGTPGAPAVKCKVGSSFSEVIRRSQ